MVPVSTAWSDETLEAIEGLTGRILEQVGVKVLSEEATKLLLGSGCVALGQNRVSIPWDVVCNAVASNPREFTIAARDEARSLRISADAANTWIHPAGGMPFVSDVQTGEIRRAKLQDVAAAARVQHHMEFPHQAGCIFTVGDVPGELDPIVSTLVAASETDKCVYFAPMWRAEQVRAAYELAGFIQSAGSGKNRFSAFFSFSPLSPLTLDRDVADAMIEAARLGAICVVLSCPTQGTTAPMPVVAAVAQMTAEVLAGLVLLQAARPNTPTLYGARLIAPDLRSGKSTPGGPEMSYSGQGATLMARRLGMACDSYGLSSDSRAADVQCGFERSIGALLGAAARPALLSGLGNLRSGLGASIDMIPLDNEILRWVFWSVGERRADEGALDIAEFKRGVLSPQGFLGIKQTRTYMRTDVVRSELVHRGSDEEWASGINMLHNSITQTRRALAHTPLGLPDSVLTEAVRIVDTAARAMGISDVPDVRQLVERAARGAAA